MKILFITPASALRRLGAYRLGGKLYGQSNSITGPLILGGILKRAGHTVELYEELNQTVHYEKLIPWADILCLSVMTCTAPRAYELADRFHKEGHARVLMGGIHVTAMPEEALQHADQVMTGESENTILDVVEGRRKERIVKGAPVCDLDSVPFPDYSILKTPCQAANILTTRGCPFRCTFCSTSRMFAPYRQRSVDNVMKEIRMYHRLGFRYMNFEDDNFTADKERAKEICRRIIAEHLQFKETFFFGRTDIAQDEELLELLSKAHLTRILIGIESLNQDALNAIHKGQNIEDIKKAAEACRRHKIRVIASIVLGLDQDTKEDIQKTLEFACSIDAYQLQPAILTPYPGTPVYEELLSQHRIFEHNWSQFDMMNATFYPLHMTPWELQNEFYGAAMKFYTFRSAFRIGKLFGPEYFLRRFGLAIFARLGPMGARFCAAYIKRSPYYELKHLMTEDAAQPSH